VCTFCAGLSVVTLLAMENVTNKEKKEKGGAWLMALSWSYLV